MKKTTLLLALFSVILFASCNVDAARELKVRNEYPQSAKVIPIAKSSLTSVYYIINTDSFLYEVHIEGGGFFPLQITQTYSIGKMSQF